MLQQIIDRRLAGQEQVDRQPRALPAPLQGADPRRGQAGRSTSAASATSSRARTSTCPSATSSEPSFRHGPGGEREIVHPGNHEYVRGDQHRAAAGRRGAAAAAAARRAIRRGRGRLRLPPHQGRVHADLLRRPRAAAPDAHAARRGAGDEEPPRRLHERRHAEQPARAPLDARRDRPPHRARRRLARASCARSRRACAEHARGASTPPQDAGASKELELQIAPCARGSTRIPFLDPIDLRYRNRVRVPVPTAKAVMFCLMDVSGSMDEASKDLAKRFFILLYLFLTRNYEKIDLVFIRHHTQAQEVDEENFFHARETGGTVVSCALVLMDEIITRATAERLEHLRRAGLRRRQLAPDSRPLPRAARREPAARAATSPTCRSPTRSRTSGRSTPPAGGRRRTSRCAR